MKKRFALIIGAAGSGTTRLFRQLGSHPQVIPCRVKEPNFFTDERKWALGVDWYRSLWDFREPDERIAVEASTDYAKHPVVACPAQRIARTPSGFRILYILRNPIERIESHQTRAFGAGWAPQALDPSVLAEHIDISRYARQLDGYREHFPAEDLLLLRFDDLVSDPPAQLRRVCRFLEIDPYFGFAELRPASAPPSRSRLAPGGDGGWLSKLPGLRRLLRRRPVVRVERSFTLTPEQRALVLHELRDDLARLESEYGFDVSGWCLEG
jgi:hypothetical protein